MENSPARSNIDVGSVIDGMYTIEALIGQGGMGSVFLASHRRLAGKKVAIKVLLADLGGEEILARFKREADIASTLDHPNIVKVENYNVLPDGTPYIAYELLHGQSLAQRLEAGPLPLEQIYSIIRGVGSGLAAAHRAGIVHRDLKPQNIFLVQSEVAGNAIELAKVLDFGISKLRGSTTVKTQDSSLLGTPQYMAPEQAMGKHSEVDQRTDIFALGAIVYEMLVGRPAFSGESIPEVVFKVVYEQPPPLGAAAPPHAAEAIACAMQKVSADRYPTVNDFVAALTGTPLSVATRTPPSLHSDAKKNSANEAFAATSAPGTASTGTPPPPGSELGNAATVSTGGGRRNAGQAAIAATMPSAPGIAATPAPVAAAGVVPAKRSPIGAIALGIGGLALAAGGAFFFLHGRPAPAPPPPHSQPIAAAPPPIDAGVVPHAPLIDAAIAAPPITADAAPAHAAPAHGGPHPATPVTAPVPAGPSDAESETRLAEAEKALAGQSYARVQSLANMVLTSDAANAGEKARAHALRGIVKCNGGDLEGANIDLQAIHGSQRKRMLAVCHANAMLTDEK